MAYSRDEAFETHKDYKENVNQWEYFIRSYNGGYDYTIGQYLNRYNLELDVEYNQRLGNTFESSAGEVHIEMLRSTIDHSNKWQADL